MIDWVRTLARRRLPVLHYALDSVFWVIGIPAGVWTRYDFDTSEIDLGVVGPVAAAVVLQGVFGSLFGLYRRKWRYGTFEEVRMLAVTTLTVGSVLMVVFWSAAIIPRSVPILATGLSILGQVAARSVWRLYIEHRLRPTGDHVEKLVLVGAGDGAQKAVRMLRTSPDSAFDAVAIVDDDPAKRNLRLSGVRVEGTLDDLLDVAERRHATAVLIAIPSAGSPLIRRMTQVAEGAGLRVFVLPPVNDLFGPMRVADIRPVTEIDLLGRHPADIDTDVIAGYVKGRRVLVTGAGGSIGSELCRQLMRFEPEALLMLDRDENGLHGTQLSMFGRAMLDDPSLVLADIRDGDRVDEVFAEQRPDVVFHAAALKHLPMLEMYPAEGWKTNVVGTMNLLAAARRHGVERFVNISTDKAAGPTSVLGWTKRIAERMTADAGSCGDTVCVSVRFGNVLGSSGSVLKAFERQSANGGPITVTHPDITRFFMTIEEAARLTIFAAAIGESGEVMILDMGEPVRILDVAERFANQHDPPLEIVFTGLRPNEKMHEDLVTTDEHGERRIHKLITHVVVPPLAPEPAWCEQVVDSITEMSAIARRG